MQSRNTAKPQQAQCEYGAPEESRRQRSQPDRWWKQGPQTRQQADSRRCKKHQVSGAVQPGAKSTRAPPSHGPRDHPACR